MKTVIEEHGAIIISSIIGFAIIGIGTDLFSSLVPMMERYLLSMM